MTRPSRPCKSLRDLAVYQGKAADFRLQMAALREQYGRRGVLIGRFERGGV